MPSLPSNCEHIRLLRRAIDRVLEPRISCDQWRSSLAWARGGQSSIDGGGYSYISQRPCRRLVRRLQKLANQFGRLAGHLIEIHAYRTQERISQTMTATRERVSAGLHPAPQAEHDSILAEWSSPIGHESSYRAPRVRFWAGGRSSR